MGKVNNNPKGKNGHTHGTGTFPQPTQVFSLPDDISVPDDAVLEATLRRYASWKFSNKKRVEMLRIDLNYHIGCVIILNNFEVITKTFTG